jgi:UDP-N-acetylmuramoyl-tripeptide--D-alanyl-D-alanine ligase
MKKFIYFAALLYLRFWAVNKLKHSKAKVIGVTGSVGKSSFIYLLDEIAKTKLKVKTTLQGNSESGIPLEILGLRDKLSDYTVLTWLKVFLLAPFYSFSKFDYDLFIVEMGVDSPFEPKNMEYLLKIVKPDIGVVLNIAPVHTEQFSIGLSENNTLNEKQIVDRIAAEKMKLVTLMPVNHVAIINSDNKYMYKYLPDIKAPITTFGRNLKADFRLLNSRVVLDQGTVFEFKYQDKKYEINFSKQLLFNEYGINILAVLATADKLGIDIRDAVKIIKKSFTLPPGRLSLFKGKKDTLLLDSSYNSSPIATTEIFEMVKLLHVKGRKIAVLGDMRELGDLSAQKHEEIAILATQTFDKIILIGAQMHNFALPTLIKSGFDPKSLFSFETVFEVGEFMEKELLKSGDLILVKGSQNTIYLEEAVSELLDNDQDRIKLCRQSNYWQKVRHNYFRDHNNHQYFPQNKKF